MPLYEYECTQCGCRVEVVQKVSDAPLRKCRKCGGALRKLISSPAIQFKGSGWYITDYAKKSAPQEEAKSKEKAPAKESCTPAASSEAKPKSEKKASVPPAEK
ncbi:MAG: zinc ribbon domain-containing protein [Acidobacteria bacterium]|nr:zinc ribbon domain-containing protein [Acidobacteriota bacterium]